MNPTQTMLTLVAIVLATACGGSSNDVHSQQAATATPRLAAISACSIVTMTEVLGATGWKSLTIDSTAIACNFRGPNEFNDIVSVMVAGGLPAMSSSAKLAEFRSSRIRPNDDVKPTITALDGFGVPAVRNVLIPDGWVTIEAAKNGRLLAVTANTEDVAAGVMRIVLQRMQ